MQLSKEQIRFYEENGYLILPNLFQEEAVNQMKQISTFIADNAKQFTVEGTGDTVKNIDGSSIVLTKNTKSEQVIKRVVWAAAAAPTLLNLGRSKEILEPVAQILESNEADHLINQLHYKDPGDEVKFPWHQDEQNRRAFDSDWQDVNKKGSFVQVLTAIDECTLDNGPLYVIPRSHTFGFLNFGKSLQTSELAAKLVDKGINIESSQIPLLLKPGDVVFMHPHLIHSSWPNNSQKSRRIFINGFSYPGANHKPYPGEGSARRISLVTGKEVVNTKSENEPLLFTPTQISQAPQLLFAPPKQNQEQEEKAVANESNLINRFCK